MKRVVLILIGIVLIWGQSLFAKSDIAFSNKFKGWKLLKHYKFPCQNIEDQPKVVRDLAVMLCPLLTKDSEIYVYVRPSALQVMQKGGEYPDGVNFAYVVTAVKGVGDIVLFKAHDLGEPRYGVFTLQGKDIEGANKLLKKTTCAACHNAWCKPAGVCVTQSWNKIH